MTEITILKLLSFLMIMCILCVVAGCICDYRERVRIKSEEREYRHIYDADKQQATDDIEALYYEMHCKGVINTK